MQLQTRMRVLAALALAALVAAAPSLAHAAQPPVKVEGLKVGLGERNQYKVGAWTPIRVQLKAGPDGFAGRMLVIAPDDDGTSTVFAREVSLNPDATEWVASYVRAGSLTSDIRIQLTDRLGHQVGRDVSSESLPQEPNSIPADQVVLGTLGHPQGVDGIPAISGFTADPRGRSEALVQVVPLRVPDGIPGRWYGYDSLDALVIDTNDKDAMAALDAGRGEALQSWVRNGGHLILAVGTNWQQVNDSVLEPMLPARPSGRTQLDDLSTLESFAGSTKPITRGLQQVSVTKLEVNEERGGKAIDSSTTPLVVRGPYGFGRVTMVALDVDQKPFSDWVDRALFWSKTIDLQRASDESSSGNPSAPNRAIMQANVTDVATLLHSALEQFGGVKLVPFGWVAFFIFLYILLIGPGDYLFLKKVLKRMELTWVTFPLIVLTVSLLAYYAAYAVKGTDLRINKVDTVDIDQQTGQLRGTTCFTIFSPQNRDYDLSLSPQPLVETRWRAGANPADTVLTWFGVPELGFGGMNSSGRLSLAGSAYVYAPAGPHQAPDKPETLQHVRVPIWSTKSFVGRWSMTSPPVVEAKLEMVGTDRLAGTVTNLLKKPLKNVNIFFGKQVYYNLGTLEPGASIQVELNENRTLVGFLEDQNRAVPNEPWNAQRTHLPRADLLRTLMFHDGGGPRATALSSHVLHFLDLTGQLALDRPMLVAEVDGEGASLFLGSEQQQPKVEQTTLVRVIMPLGKAKAAAEEKTRKAE